MRVRRKVAKKWELENARRHLYVGKGMGANVAAWKQVAAAELAATMKSEVRVRTGLARPGEDLRQGPALGTCP